MRVDEAIAGAGRAGTTPCGCHPAEASERLHSNFTTRNAADYGTASQASRRFLVRTCTHFLDLVRHAAAVYLADIACIGKHSGMALACALRNSPQSACRNGRLPDRCSSFDWLVCGRVIRVMLLDMS